MRTLKPMPSIRTIATKLLFRRLSLLISICLLLVAAFAFLVLRSRYMSFASSEMGAFTERLDARAKARISANHERAQLLRQFIRLTPQKGLSGTAHSFAIRVLDNTIITANGDILGTAICLGPQVITSLLKPAAASQREIEQVGQLIKETCKKEAETTTNRAVIKSAEGYIVSIASQPLYFSGKEKGHDQTERMVFIAVHSPTFFEDAWAGTHFRLKHLGIEGAFQLVDNPKEVSSTGLFSTVHPLRSIQYQNGTPLWVSGQLFPKRMWYEFAAILGACIALFVLLIWMAIKVTRKTLKEVFVSIDDLNNDIGEIGKTSFQSSVLSNSPLEIASIRQSVENLRLRVLEHEKELKRTEGDRAIARTTQMLAHDVRKPLSMSTMLINQLSDAKSMDEVGEILKSALPNIETAQREAESMIQDIMDFGGETTLSLETVQVEAMIHSSLSEAFASAKQADVHILYNFQHQRQIGVDAVKVIRIFANIIGNAILALEGNGTIWFKTKQISYDSRDFLEICIGNSGPLIEENDFPKVFDLFYTCRKTGGTGFGLAIAKKFVTAHGGTIWCSQESGVEFHFTLPLTDQKNLPVQTLPSHSSAYCFNLNSDKRHRKDLGTEKLEGELIALIKNLDKKLRILIVDDEAIYRDSILGMISRSPFVADVIDISAVGTFQDAIVQIVDKPPQVCITDIDLGEPVHNGLDIVRYMRKGGIPSVICVHSNRFLSGDSKIAVAAGADIFLPKPLSWTHLLKILILAAGQALEKKVDGKKTTENYEIASQNGVLRSM